MKVTIGENYKRMRLKEKNNFRIYKNKLMTKYYLQVFLKLADYQNQTLKQKEKIWANCRLAPSSLESYIHCNSFYIIIEQEILSNDLCNIEPGDMEGILILSKMKKMKKYNSEI